MFYRHSIHSFELSIQTCCLFLGDHLSYWVVKFFVLDANHIHVLQTFSPKSGLSFSLPKHEKKEWSEVKRWLRIHVLFFVTPWTRTHQAFLSMEFSWEEYWIKLPFPSPGALPDPGIEKTQVSCIAGKLFTIWATREAHFLKSVIFNSMCHLG